VFFGVGLPLIADTVPKCVLWIGNYGEIDSSDNRKASKTPFTVTINLIDGRQLRRPLSVIVEEDDGEYIARTPDLPLYGAGKTAADAVGSIKRELASLLADLMEDNEFTDEWLAIKRFFLENTVD